MTAGLSDLDQRVLAVLQDGVPLVARPWEQLGAGLRATGGQVLARVEALSGPRGVIREIAGLFDAGALGYRLTLVAARCDPERLDEAGQAAAAHPGVSHCYARAGELNLWFTLAVGPDSVLGLDRTVAALAEQMRAQRVVSLPALRRYKLRVRFPPDDAKPVRSGEPADEPAGAPRRALAATAEQVRAIRALQQPLPLVAEPFHQLAHSAGLNADDLLVRASDFLAAGWMRRYAAVLHHRRAGALANVLVAWELPASAADGFGAQASAFAAVSHCYLREPAEGWPFNLYTMIHGRDTAAVERTIQSIAAAGGDYPRVALPTVREYKKARVRLFSEDLARWESAVVD